MTLSYTTKAQHGTWFVLKAYGKSHQPWEPLVATSAPIYVSVNGDKFWRRDSVEEIAQKYKSRLITLRNNDKRLRVGEWPLTEKTWQQQWPEQKKLLNQRIDWAVEFLDQLMLSATVQK